MGKRLWINIGLLVCILFLTVILLNTEEETKQELPRISTIDQNDIVQIEVSRNELEDLVFNKQGENWHMHSPLQFRANNARINALLRMLKVESYGQLNPPEVKLESLGLDDPIVVMKLNDHEFKFGNTDAIDQRRYVLFNNKIHLTNDFLYHQLMTNAAFFADQKLLPENFKISAIEFPENKMELFDGQWKLEKLMDISPDQLKRIVSSWESVSAVSTDPFQSSEAESIIKISTINNESIQFVIVSIEPHLILGRKDLGVRFHMGSDETKKLLLIEGVDINEETEPVGLELY